MRSYSLLALLAGAAYATPMPQDLDWDAIDESDPLPIVSIPIVSAAAAATTIPYDAAAAASSISTAVQADPTDSTLKMMVRSTVDNSGCGANTPSASDTDAAFSSNANFNSVANSASTPSGYIETFSGLNGSNIGVMGYMGFTVLPTYDTAACAARCNKINGCSSFNLYYERDPSVAPSATCTNPASVTVIKCVFYGGEVTAKSATNYGQWRRDFHVVIQGSNGYVNATVATPSGYTPPIYVGEAAINAPLDCNGADTYMQVKIFTDGIFNVQNCATACSAQTAYNTAHPPTDGSAVRTCQFFNTYVLYKNAVAVGQYCSLYTESWSPAFATNYGQTRGSDKYTIGYSYISSNTTGGLDKPVGCTNPTAPSS